MDATIWHRQAQRAAQPAPLATPLCPASLTQLSTTELATYAGEVSAGLRAIPLPSGTLSTLSERMAQTVAASNASSPGSKDIIALDAPFAAGKSTFVKGWARKLYRSWVGPMLATDRPVWHPEPHLTAAFIPVVYVTLIAGSTVKELNAQILTYLGYPSEGLARVTTTRVIAALKAHGVRLIVLDDVHMAKTTSTAGRHTLDYLKFLNSELGELGGTLTLVGAWLERGPILTDPQIHGRLRLFQFQPFSIASTQHQAQWQDVLRNAEQVVLPYLGKAKPGILTSCHAGMLWRRTQGYLGDLAQLVADATVAALMDRSLTLTRDHLAHVNLSARAQSSEADIVATQRRPSDVN